MYTFIANHDNYKITVTTEAYTASELVEAFRAFMLASGFHPNTVAEVLPDAP